ncbi:MAG: BolA family protein [Alphaproteobacteria bacterium]
MPLSDVLRDKLRRAFSPTELIVEDESAQHAGHASAHPRGETHFRVRIVSHAFEGQSRIERQRRVFTALAEEMNTRVHALSLTTLAPSEVA